MLVTLVTFVVVGEYIRVLLANSIVLETGKDDASLDIVSDFRTSTVKVLCPGVSPKAAEFRFQLFVQLYGIFVGESADPVPENIP